MGVEGFVMICEILLLSLLYQVLDEGCFMYVVDMLLLNESI